MKQRALTDIQLTVLTMKMAGNSNFAIAAVIHVHPHTVSCKWRDIQKGITKGAYHNLPQELRATGDLFEVINFNKEEPPILSGADRTTSGWIGQP